MLTNGSKNMLVATPLLGLCFLGGVRDSWMISWVRKCFGLFLHGEVASKGRQVISGNAFGNLLLCMCWNCA